MEVLPLKKVTLFGIRLHLLSPYQSLSNTESICLYLIDLFRVVPEPTQTLRNDNHLCVPQEHVVLATLHFSFCAFLSSLLIAFFGTISLSLPRAAIHSSAGKQRWPLRTTLSHMFEKEELHEFRSWWCCALWVVQGLFYYFSRVYTGLHLYSR